MAARLNRKWAFYVYEILANDGLIAYVGKGSRSRLSEQCRRFGLAGREVARFYRERDAYKYEAQRIAETRPPLNKNAGGWGGVCGRSGLNAMQRMEREIKSIGSRVCAARLLLKYDLSAFLGQSELERLRRVAYG
jgi:hypothetical protein